MKPAAGFARTQRTRRRSQGCYNRGAESPGNVCRMFHIILFEPEIPPNTGNVIRLCANTGCQLHLVEPLGFSLDDTRLKRAGLDYHEYATLRTYPSLQAWLASLQPTRVFAFSARGRQRHDLVSWQPGDTLLFGPETRGLPQELLDDLPPEQRLRLPMRAESRSLNLANTVSVAIYEAWRQQDFAGSA